MIAYTALPFRYTSAGAITAIQFGLETKMSSINTSDQSGQWASRAASFSNNVPIISGQWATKAASFKLKCGAQSVQAIIDSGATTSDFWSQHHSGMPPLRRFLKIGDRTVAGLVDTGTDVNIVSPRLAAEPTFQKVAYKSRGHCTISLCGEPVTLHNPYRVLVETPGWHTAYMDTFYVSPVPMTMDLVLRPTLPFSRKMSALVIPVDSPEYKIPINFNKLFALPHNH